MGQFVSIGPIGRNCQLVSMGTIGINWFQLETIGTNWFQWGPTGTIGIQWGSCDWFYLICIFAVFS